MKILRRKAIKTEPSEQQLQKKNAKGQQWLLFSHFNKHSTHTSTMFVHDTLNNKQNNKLYKHSPEQRQTRKSYKDTAKTEISQTVDIVRSLWRDQEQAQDEQHNYVTPFSLPQADALEEQLSFRGVANKQRMIQSISRLDRQLNMLLLDIETFNSWVEGANTNQLLSQSKQKDSSQVFYHVKKIESQISDFRAQYSRCVDIANSTPGIADKTLMFYQSRFQIILKQLKSKWRYLQQYQSLVAEPTIKISSRRRARQRSEFDAR